jgi:ABC-2 type transport system ATP-binding protein
MQEVEATCSRLLILNRGRLVAQGSVQELMATRSGRARYVVEGVGQGISETLSALPGVESHRREEMEGRDRVLLEVTGEDDLRPKIFSLAQEQGWVLWELHRERASLEDVFRKLTSERGEVEA